MFRDSASRHEATEDLLEPTTFDTINTAFFAFIAAPKEILFADIWPFISLSPTPFEGCHA